MWPIAFTIIHPCFSIIAGLLMGWRDDHVGDDRHVAVFLEKTEEVSRLVKDIKDLPKSLPNLCLLVWCSFTETCRACGRIFGRSSNRMNHRRNLRLGRCECELLYHVTLAGPNMNLLQLLKKLPKMKKRLKQAMITERSIKTATVVDSNCRCKWWPTHFWLADPSTAAPTNMFQRFCS